VALGGNALLQRGQELNAENQRENIRIAARQLAEIHKNHQLIIAHGNGPQVGLLALMDAAYTAVDPYPLDVLGAETVGMIGYMIEQELGNIIPLDDHIVTVLTQILVDPVDPAFQNPTKPVGPIYDQTQAERLRKEKGWSMAPDGEHFRRVVPSPLPQRIIELNAIRMLVDSGVVVICAGGGGIPTAHDKDLKLYGVEAVIDGRLFALHGIGCRNVRDVDRCCQRLRRFWNTAAATNPRRKPRYIGAHGLCGWFHGSENTRCL
jgi:carbamate kinase